MTAHYQIDSREVAADAPTQICDVKCVEPSGMVSQERLSEEPSPASNDAEIRIEEWSEEGHSSSSGSDQESEDETSQKGLEIADPDDCVGHFGNIVVKNSSDVQFGNNTYYQGPVTIKQFVYKGAQEGQLSIEDSAKDNLAFVPECVVGEQSDECVKCEKDAENADKNGNVVRDNASSDNVGGKWLNYVYRSRSFYAICLSVLLTVSVVLLTIVLVKKYQYSTNPGEFVPDSDEQDNNTPIDPANVNVTLSGKLRIIQRLEWLAQPPSEPPSPLVHPVKYVIILHTATETCADQASCIFHVRNIQTFHIESKHWWDIAYNFLVGGDGYAYEGRGWFSQGANAYGYNNMSIGISFIGTFQRITPPPRQLLAARQLIELGVRKGYIAKNYKLMAHRQLSATQSPGDALYKIIQTWPHWSENP